MNTKRGAEEQRSTVVGLRRSVRLPVVILLITAVMLSACSTADDPVSAEAAIPTASASDAESTSTAEPDEEPTVEEPAAEETTGDATEDVVADAAEDAEDTFDPTELVGGPGETVELAVVSYGYELLPERVRTGTSLAMVNRAQTDDFHTVIVYRLDDDDTRDVADLAALELEPDSDIVAGYGTLQDLGGTVVGTLSAPPGAPGRQLQDGATTLTLDEPGRYLLFDTLPIDVSIEDAINAENTGDFSGLQDGPFHYEEGEIAIIEVVDDAADADDADAGGATQPHEEALFYGNFESGMLLFAGATTEAFCNDEQPTNPSTVTPQDDGGVLIEVQVERWPLYLYESPVGAPELIDATCEALFDDDPGTVPVEPVATGHGSSRMRIHIMADGTVQVMNTTEGTVTDDREGTTFDVNGFADLQVVEGVPVGDPAEFQGLEVTRAGNKRVGTDRPELP